MNDILSQIIAYSPNKIDTEKKARAMVQGPRNMKLAEVPRSEMDNFNTPDLEQSPDSFLRPGETLEDFDVEFRRPNAQGGVIGKPGGVVEPGVMYYGKNVMSGSPAQQAENIRRENESLKKISELFKNKDYTGLKTSNKASKN